MGRSSGRRRAASLTEVLIALVILTIGLTSVIALFPVGVNRVRNATLDTRTTIVASNANALFHLKRMANDPALVDLAAYDVMKANGFSDDAAGFIFDDPVRNPLAFTAWSPNVATTSTPGNWFGGTFPTDHAVPVSTLMALFRPPTPPPPSILNLRWDIVPRDDETDPVNWTADFRERLIAEDDDVFALFGTVVARTDVQEVGPDYNLSYPVLLDPYLYDAMCFQFGLLGASGFTGGVPRINIATALTRSDSTTVVPGFENYYGSALFTGTVRPFADIAVLSLSEITLLPAAAVSIDRETVKARWFASSADINYATDVPGQPVNPSSQDYLDTSTPPLLPLTPNNYIEPVPVNQAAPPSLANPIRPTAIRDYEYTWAAMIQRRLVAPPEGGITDPTVARPNLVDREFKGKLAILCFYRRNLQQPYRVIEGCFYTGSRVATLSWPSNLPAPTINVGTWLCEASISRSTATTSFTGVNPDPLLGSTATLSGTYVDKVPFIVDYDEATLPLPLPTLPSRRIYRRSFSFHRVTAVNEPVDLPDGRSYVQVTLERPAVGFPLEYRNPANPLLVGAQSGQDDRPIDPYPAVAGNPKYSAWPIIDRRSAPATLSLGTNDETNCSQADAVGIPRDQYSFYYPVIIFDGLREVFEYNAE